MKSFRLRTYIYFLIIAMLVGLNCSKKQNNSGLKSNPDISFSDIQLVNLDGTQVNLDSLKGKSVFLNIWATWCKPCLAEMPSIERAFQQLKGSGIVFLAASDESLEKILAFKNTNDYNFRFIHLKSGIEAINIYTLPTTILFDKTGNLVSVERGGYEWDSPEAIQKLFQLK